MVLFNHFPCWTCSWSLGILVAIGQLAVAGSEPPSRPPNILLILVDNVGKDWLGCYGSQEGQTPNIDSLAASGLRVNHCYVTPLCSTTRVALLTGRYGFRTGWHTHHDAAIYGGGYFDWEREITFARVLKSAGYATAVTGKWQLNDFYDQTDAIKRHGFDEHLLWSGALVGEGDAESRWKRSLVEGREIESRYWDPIVFRNGERIEATGRFGPEMYVEYLIDFIGRNRRRPFLAFYSTPLVHIPVVATPLSRRVDATEREQFAAMVRYVDQQVGQLVAALEELSLRGNTIVVVTTDNGSPGRLTGRVSGTALRGGLGRMTEPGLDVPLIVNCPGVVPSGQVSDQLVDCSDFLPTFAELAGAKLPEGVRIDGHSFADVVRGLPGSRSPRQWIFSQYATTRIVRDHRFKLYSTGALYNVLEDPAEADDLAGSEDERVASAFQRLQGVLDRLPPDAKLPFQPRSQSAFRLRGKDKRKVKETR
jgi:arylsulfatase A-like enzyme